MADKSFANQKQLNKSAMDGTTAETAASTPEHEMTGENDWSSHQQKVSKNSPNLYTVTDDENETAMTGDGYSVKNGIVDAPGDFFDTAYSQTSEKTEGKKIKVVEHEGPGLVLSPGKTPSKEELVREDENGKTVVTTKGSIDDPDVYKDVSDKYLFAEGGPNQNDVAQVGIGDCYFWGAVLQILAHDPAKISSMMKLNGGTVETTLYHKQGRKWVESKVSRPIGIGGVNCQYKENESRFEQRECGVRVDTTTVGESAWKASIFGSTCHIERTDYYKAALWANCLEQAYSDFSRDFGKYGAGAEESPDSGDEEFESGCADSCMRMFYGSDASKPGTFAVLDSGSGRTKVLKSLIEFKKTLNGTGGYNAIGARRRMGDPNTNSAHVYSIENVSFVDKNGKPIDFTDNTGIFGFVSDISERKSIDTTKSKLLLRNPWNSPDSDKGKYFEITLEEFFTNDEWTHIYEAEISERTQGRSE